MNWIIAAFVFAFGSATSGVVLIVYALLNFEKFEKLSAYAFKILSSSKTLFRGAHKQYLKHDLQGRINEFIKTLKGDAPYLAETRVRVEWVEGGVTRKSFLEDGKVVLRLRRDDRHDENFVHGSYLFVSSSLLSKAKRYISQSQGQAIDLFVTTKLLEKEKASVVAIFLDQYLHPKVGDQTSKVARYYDAAAKLDRRGYFYPVLLQELEFLGDKVFGKRQDSRIIGEVDALIDFLEPIAERRVGDLGNLNFEREYCRFAIMIVGRRDKLAEAGAGPYLNYVRKQILPHDIESFYLIGPLENQDVIESVSSSLSDRYEPVVTRTSKVKLRIDSREVERDQYLVVLRKRGVPVFQPSG